MVIIQMTYTDSEMIRTLEGFPISTDTFFFNYFNRIAVIYVSVNLWWK